MALGALSLALLAGGACTKPEPTHAGARVPPPHNRPHNPLTPDALSLPEADPASEARFNNVRDLFETYCGSCHLPHGEYAFDLPLSVYDLTDPAPLSALSDAQLAEAYRRFDEQNIPDEEQKRLQRFFLQTLRFRNENDNRFPLSQRSAPATDAVVTPKTGCFGRACFASFADDFADQFANRIDGNTTGDFAAPLTKK